MKKPIKHLINWQRHYITSDVDSVKLQRPDFKADKAIILTGTLVSDESGKFNAGDHTRTSLVIEYYGDIYETGNTVYILDGKEGDPITDCKDWGINVAGLYY